MPDAEGRGQVVGGEAVRQVQEVGALREAQAQPDLVHRQAFCRQRRVPGLFKCEGFLTRVGEDTFEMYTQFFL